MNLFESHFWYNKRQRNGILFLVFILILLQIALLFVDFSADENQQIDKDEFYAIQGKIDSLKRSGFIYPFSGLKTITSCNESSSFSFLVIPFNLNS